MITAKNTFIDVTIDGEGTYQVPGRNVTLLQFMSKPSLPAVDVDSAMPIH
jgi:hypothetical protein